MPVEIDENLTKNSITGVKVCGFDTPTVRFRYNIGGQVSWSGRNLSN